jgi:glucose-1-phosphate thymidylyltransferase
MIRGIVPIGGKGTRLGLPFPKEMLPQKNNKFYNPIVNHLVSKMVDAGCEEIIFVHGFEYKKEVIDFYTEDGHSHILQKRLGFSNVLADALHYVREHVFNTDEFLFGMPDTVFEDNPFFSMVEVPGLVCALFTAEDSMRVDRLSLENDQLFNVKSPKTDNNSELFWGLIKFDADTLFDIVDSGIISNTKEIGNIINNYNKSYINGKNYYDLGTWDSYNRYINDTSIR